MSRSHQLHQRLTSSHPSPASLEKSLRMTHALIWVASALSTPPLPLISLSTPPLPLISLVTARTQLAATRRFFRLAKWIDCFVLAFARFGVLALSTPPAYPPASAQARQVRREQTRLAIEMAKFTMLGCYLFTEMFTITNVIGLTDFAWGVFVQREANKFWLYAIVCGIVLSLFDLWVLVTTSPATGLEANADAKNAAAEAVSGTPGKRGRGRPRKTVASESEAADDKAAVVDDRRKESERHLAEQKRQVYKALVVDCCDVFIPGSAVGWIRVDSLTVGLAMSISTAIPLRDMWLKAKLQP